jgi:hypothetical protein
VARAAPTPVSAHDLPGTHIGPQVRPASASLPNRVQTYDAGDPINFEGIGTVDPGLAASELISVVLPYAGLANWARARLRRDLPTASAPRYR